MNEMPKQMVLRTRGKGLDGKAEGEIGSKKRKRSPDDDSEEEAEDVNMATVAIVANVADPDAMDIDMPEPMEKKKMFSDEEVNTETTVTVYDHNSLRKAMLSHYGKDSKKSISSSLDNLQPLVHEFKGLIPEATVVHGAVITPTAAATIIEPMSTVRIITTPTLPVELPVAVPTLPPPQPATKTTTNRGVISMMDYLYLPAHNREMTNFKTRVVRSPNSMFVHVSQPSTVQSVFVEFKHNPPRQGDVPRAVIFNNGKSVNETSNWEKENVTFECVQADVSSQVFTITTFVTAPAQTNKARRKPYDLVFQLKTNASHQNVKVPIRVSNLTVRQNEANRKNNPYMIWEVKEMHFGPLRVSSYDADGNLKIVKEVREEDGKKKPRKNKKKVKLDEAPDGAAALLKTQPKKGRKTKKGKGENEEAAEAMIRLAEKPEASKSDKPEMPSDKPAENKTENKTA